MVNEALARGIPPVLGARDPHKLDALASSLRLEHRCSKVDDPGSLSALLQDVTIVVNAAGPFRATAMPLVRACLSRGVHYLDIGGEVRALEQISALDREARARGVMLMPAAGFDVVASDCTAARVAKALPDAIELSIGLTGLNAISRGSAESVIEQYHELVLVRRAGRLIRVLPGRLERDFDFGEGPCRTSAITWGDVVTAYYSTRIANITVFYESTPLVRAGLEWSRYFGWLAATAAWKPWLRAGARALPEGPAPTERASGRALVVAEAMDRQGNRASLRTETPEVYGFTAQCAIAIADRVLHNDFSTGFQTPALAFGPDFVLGLPGVRQSELVTMRAS
jgi:short subunit dehydrogenase-like uncharacterized protein